MQWFKLHRKDWETLASSQIMEIFDFQRLIFEQFFQKHGLIKECCLDFFSLKVCTAIISGSCQIEKVIQHTWHTFCTQVCHHSIPKYQRILCITSLLGKYLLLKLEIPQLLPLPNVCLMPCPFTGPKMFCAGPNFLSQSNNLFTYCASHKYFVVETKR